MNLWCQFSPQRDEAALTGAGGGSAVSSRKPEFLSLVRRETEMEIFFFNAPSPGEYFCFILILILCIALGPVRSKSAPSETAL